MKKMSPVRARRALLAGLLLACGCAAPVLERISIAHAARRSATPGAISTEVRDLFDRINRHRRELGCTTLVWDRRLAALALRHSQDMARRQFFDHTNPDGLGPFDRMERAGLRYHAAAENLAMGATTGDEVFEGWMHSRGHRRNLENCIYTRIGIGRYDDYWSCELAKLTPESTP
jgi:uncharacterized protein YkwD